MFIFMKMAGRDHVKLLLVLPQWSGIENPLFYNIIIIIFLMKQKIKIFLLKVTSIKNLENLILRNLIQSC